MVRGYFNWEGCSISHKIWKTKTTNKPQEYHNYNISLGGGRREPQSKIVFGHVEINPLEEASQDFNENSSSTVLRLWGKLPSLWVLNIWQQLYLASHSLALEFKLFIIETNNKFDEYVWDWDNYNQYWLYTDWMLSLWRPWYPSMMNSLNPCGMHMEKTLPNWIYPAMVRNQLFFFPCSVTKVLIRIPYYFRPKRYL